MVRDRLARMLEVCTTATGDFTHPNLASWEREALLEWRGREPLVLSIRELTLMCKIEQALLGISENPKSYPQKNAVTH
jgi:hypothetical protein